MERRIIFKDINGNYNIAGNPVNIASRVMGFGDRQQILITDEAYKNMIDMTEDTELESKFRTYERIQIKHNVVISVHQYVGAGENFINTGLPIQVELQTHINVMQQNPIFKGIAVESTDPNERIQMLEQVTQMMSLMGTDITGEIAKFMGLLTSAEGADNMREYLETNKKIVDLRKTMLKE